jgi:diguanylate cyclase (GGDEF)-like protein
LWSGVKVLVAEEEAVSREMLSTQLIELGYEVVVVPDGARAREVLDSPESPQLAVMEVVELNAHLHAGERIQALEAELQLARSYLDAVLASIDSGVMLVDGEGTVVVANAILETLLDRTPGGLVGLSRAEVMRAMVERFDQSSAFARALTPPDGIPVAPLMAEWEMQRPRRRVIRWSAHRVPLGEGWGLLEICRDVTAEADTARGLREQALRDPLTGQLNRRGGAAQLEREIARAHREQRPLAVAMMDVDHFKQVNDRFGHEVGDAVLRALASTMAECLRAYDFVARWGGEEWLAVMPGASLADGLGVIERVRAAIDSARIDGLPPVTVSAGVDQLRAHETTADPLISRADAKLYQAKAAGRNRVV